MNRILIFLLIAFFPTSANNITEQPIGNQEIAVLIQELKEDRRGPYRDIRWFCPDGSVNLPREYCKDEGGIQHARYKFEVEELAEKKHIYFGQILSAAERDEFWDAANNNSRAKQYQLEKYLRRIDDGWIMRRGQYYRGAFQMQDEEAWGIDFMKRMLSKNHLLDSKFYLLRQLAKDIPHKGEDYQSEQVWALSKYIGDRVPEFLNIRVKIHGQPDISDLDRVNNFLATHKNNLSNTLLDKFDELILNMEEIYQPPNLRSLRKYIRRVAPNSQIRKSLEDFVITFTKLNETPAKLMATAEKLMEIREEIFKQSSRTTRLALLDISIYLEEIYYLEMSKWQISTLDELMNKICYSGLAATGTGLLEAWEWESVVGNLAMPMDEEFTLTALINFEENAQRLVEWGSAMPRATYQDVVELYSGFEPLAEGFYDERVRNSVLLPMGQSVSKFGNFLAKESNLSNQVFDISNQSNIRGMNPGYALGELIVMEDPSEAIEISDEKIYVFDYPPVDLQPVAGIATVSEGNLVSHIQLLARNHGIPNMVLSRENLQELKKYAGQEIFFAVSNEGTAIMKRKSEMTAIERKLFSNKKRAENRIAVPMNKIDLAVNHVLNMNDLDASDAGITCGPKAANLGELKKLFPDKVVEGIVIPFGIFREHLDLPMPGQEVSYWEFLNNIFKVAESMREDKADEEHIEKYVLAQLSTLRSAIALMPLKESFFEDLVLKFEAAFGEPPGLIPVFVRSDTNMEDLKGFSGAGLNKTLFNVVDFAEIIDGIRTVWASPYSERSYKWRQNYLLNPENVFPSILIIPSVDVDYSGVMITKGIPTKKDNDLTVAFSRGAGGAVEGQAAESWLLNSNNENILLSPARESKYRRLPITGGTSSHRATYEKSILNEDNIYELRKLAWEVNQQLAFSEEEEYLGPFDIELGFKDDAIWLFQIRPFVENKRALSSDYLSSITPVIDKNKLISGNTEIGAKQNDSDQSITGIEL